MGTNSYEQKGQSKENAEKNKKIKKIKKKLKVVSIEPVDSGIGPCDSSVGDESPKKTANVCVRDNFISCDSTVSDGNLSHEISIESFDADSEDSVPLPKLAKKIQQKNSKKNAATKNNTHTSTQSDESDIHTMMFGPQPHI